MGKSVDADDLKRRTEARIRKIEVHLGNGKAVDWADYKRLAGEVSGLRDSLKDLDEVAKRDPDNGDDDE